MFSLFKKKNRCPYCGVIIEKEIKGKFKCPACTEEIFISKEADKIHLITRQENDQLKEEKKRKAEENKYIRFFQDFDIDEAYLIKRKEEWFIKLKEKAAYDDLTWSVANELLQTYAKQNQYNKMQMLYFAMAGFQYDRKKDFFHLLQESVKMNLYATASNLPDMKYKLEILGNGCKISNEQNGLKFTLQEALEKMPIPRKECENNGWCTCFYAVVLEK